MGFQATLTHPGDRLVTGLRRAWGRMSSQAQREDAGGMSEGVSQAAGQQDSCGNTQAGRGGLRAVHGDCSGCTDAEQLLLDLAEVKPPGKAGPLHSEDRAGWEGAAAGTSCRAPVLGGQGRVGGCSGGNVLQGPCAAVTEGRALSPCPQVWAAQGRVCPSDS